MATPMSHSEILKTAMDKLITVKFGHAVPPPPYITPFGVRTLDALLGGGFSSSAPIALSSTPETGKSTIALQFAASFLRTHESAVVVYINIEEASGGDPTMANVEIDTSIAYHDITTRIANFGIDPKRFLNKPLELNVKEVFELMTQLIEVKVDIQNRTGREFKMMIIWDSIAATPSSKDAAATDPNEIIG